MNWDQIKGQWRELRGKAKEKWGRLTNDDLDVIDGQREQLIGKVQEVYGKTREEARREVDSFGDSCQSR